MKLVHFLLPRLEYILLMALFWSIAASGPRILNFDGDLPRHILLGQLIRESRSVPLTDAFSFRTDGFPSIPHEWLSQVIFSIANDLLGLGGVVLLTALVVTAAWGVVFYEASRRTSSLFTLLLVMALGMAASMIHVLPRPHLFTYLFTAVWIVLLERIVTGTSRHWWWLPIVMAVWVNLHGMFVLGMILWGTYLLGDLLETPFRTWWTRPTTRSMLLAGTLSMAATFLSPSGINIWDAILALGSNSYITSRIPEYQTANFHLPETWPFILLLILTLAAFARTSTRIPWRHIGLTVSFTAMALYTSRMIPLFAIVIVPVAAKAVGDWLGQEFSSGRFGHVERNISALNSTSSGSVWMVILLAALVFTFGSGRTIDPQSKGNVFDGAFFPVQAVDWLDRNPQPGRMFNEFDWGGYLLLHLSPRQQIFMDGHTHIYGERLTREYETVVSRGRGWQEILENYKIEWAIVRTGSPVASALVEANWKTVYQDETAVILRNE